MSTKHVAYLALGLGLCAGLGSNVAHAVQESGTGIVPITAAVFWPVALLLCSEILFRVPFRCAADYVTGTAVALVGLGAGYISFGHTRALLSTLGEAETACVLGALAVDGVLVAAGLTLYRESQRAVPAQAAQEAVPVQPVPVQPVPAQVAQEPVPVQRVPAAQEAVPVQRVPVQAAQPVQLHAVQGDPVHELKAQGKSVRAIAEELSISPSTVQRRLKQSA